MDYLHEEEFSKNIDISLWKKMSTFFIPYKNVIIKIALLMIALSSLDAFFPLATKYALDNFIQKKDLSTMPVFATIYILAIASQCFVLYFFISLGAKLETGIVYDIRKACFAKLQQLSFSYFDKTPAGWIIARVTTDTQRIGSVVAWSIVDIFWALAILVIVFICMLFINIKLTLIIFAVMPVLSILSFYFQKRILKNQREVRKFNSKITAAINEGIMGAKTTKTITREDENLKEFSELTLDMKNVSIRSAVLSSIYLPIVMSVSTVAVGMIVYYGGNDVIAGAISFGTLSVFVSYSMQMFEPVQQVARILSEIQSAQASAERAFSLIETKSDISDSTEIAHKYENSSEWEPIKGDIVFENVSFEYKKGQKILDNFNLHVKQGERVALVGATGAGKSTIVNLICRFYEPTEGTIKIDGVDYRERSQLWLHSNLGYVLQTPHLFSGTIMDNIKYAKLDATDEEVIEASKSVGAYPFIMKKEKGFMSEVGEGGDKLSTGEKQLISFARAIIANPAIFVLDEATSSIDTETENLIKSAIDSILHGRTSFIIAHRLSTIRTSDTILVIQNGKVIEEGNHRDLIALKGHYYKLYTNQFKEEEEKKIIERLSE